MAETAAARLSRLLAMVPWLEQHPGVSIREAADHFEVTPTELERDLWLTICCGLPGHGPDQLIDIQFWDEEGSIQVIDPQNLGRPLRLSASEAMSLLVGLRLLAQVPGEHDRSALASATAKLEAAADVAQGMALVVAGDVDAMIDSISDAVRRQCALQLVYAGASRDELTERVVEPREVVQHAGRAYLAAWCREAGAQRTFRLDRIRSVEVLPDDAVARAAIEDREVVSITPTTGHVVRLRVHPRSRWILESWEAAQVQEEQEGAFEASITVADLDWLVRIVLGQAGGVEVLDPPHVREQVRDSARRALEGSEPA